jgi:hypothetical protein
VIFKTPGGESAMTVNIVASTQTLGTTSTPKGEEYSYMVTFRIAGDGGLNTAISIPVVAGPQIPDAQQKAFSILRHFLREVTEAANKPPN